MIEKHEQFRRGQRVWVGLLLNPLYSGNPLRGTLANSEVPYVMLHHAAFHQGLHYLLR